MKNNVLVAENNTLYRRFLETILPENYPAFNYLFASSATTARQQADKLEKLYCLVTDYFLGEGEVNGIQLAEEFRGKFPDIKIIIIASHISDPLRAEAQEHRIYNCVSKFNGLYEWIKLIGI